MFDQGFLTKDGTTYEWGVSHTKKTHYWNVNGGHIEWVAVTDGENFWKYDNYSYLPTNTTVRDLVKALIERFIWEGEQ